MRQLGEPGDRVKDASSTGRCSGAKPDIPEPQDGLLGRGLASMRASCHNYFLSTGARSAARYRRLYIAPCRVFTIPNLGDGTYLSGRAGP